MAVTKLWPVRGKADSALRYVADEMKTENPKWDKSSLENLTDVMHYAADEDKTEKQFFVTGINCSAEIARDQFVTVKKQFNKSEVSNSFRYRRDTGYCIAFCLLRSYVT